MQGQILALTRMAQGDLFGSNVRVVHDANSEPWFVAKDVCEILGIVNPRDALSNLDDDEKGVANTDTLGGEQTLNTVSESGLYSLILRSRKPEAKVFKRWITHEVLPSLRKVGLYSGDADEIGETLMRCREYLALRGIEGSASGLGHSVSARLRRGGTDLSARKPGTGWRIADLDETATNRPSKRGPITERPGTSVFFYDRSASCTEAFNE